MQTASCPRVFIIAPVLLLLLLFAMTRADAQENSQDDLLKRIEALETVYSGRIQELEQRVVELEKREKELQAQITEAESQPRQLVISTSGNDNSKTVLANGETSTLMDREILDFLEDHSVTRGFEFSGYLRSGYGVTEDSETFEAFQAPGAQSKYRLGNESETYIETSFAYTFPELELEEGKEFRVEIRPSYVISDALGNAETTTSIREAFGSATGIWESQPEASFWAGQRFYDRHDVHITDFYYLDMSGFGGGVEEIDVGIGKFSIAWLGGSIDSLNSNATEEIDPINTKNSLDLRLYEVPVPGGDAFVWLNVAHSESRFRPNSQNVNVDGASGVAGGLGHFSDEFWGGRNIAMVQYGVGAAANFRSIQDDFGFLGPDPLGPPLQVDEADAWHFRFVEDLLIQPTREFSMQATFVWDEQDYGATNGGSRSSWVSAGLRPQYHFTKHFSLAFEAGADFVDGPATPQGQLYKFTIAPQITPDWDFLSRPALRLFLTYATWSDSLEGFVAPRTRPDDTEGFSAGVQVEAWW